LVKKRFIETPESRAELARIRQEGAGVWHVHFVVLGYDEEFIMRAPGKLSEPFVVELTRQGLAKALRVKRKDVVFKEARKDT